jgi:hypothetical protein
MVYRKAAAGERVLVVSLSDSNQEVITQRRLGYRDDWPSGNNILFFGELATSNAS